MRFRDMPKLPLVLIALMVVVGVAVYPHLPARIPVHWGPSGRIDGWAATSPLSVFFAPLLTGVLYLVLWFVPYLDPHRGNLLRSVKAYSIAVELLAAMMTVVFLGQLYASLNTRLPMASIVEVATGLMFIGLGSVIGRVKRNWTMGFRYRWTLSDDEVWEKTNRLGGWMMMGAGVLAVLGALLGPFVGLLFLIVPAIVMLPVTYGYSMRLYKKLHADDLGPPDEIVRAGEDAALQRATQHLADPREKRIEVICPRCGAPNAPMNEECIVCDKPLRGA